MRMEKGSLHFQDDGYHFVSQRPLALLRSGGDDDSPGRRVPGCRLHLEVEEGRIEGSLVWERSEGPLSVPLSLRVEDGDLHASVGPVVGLLPRERIELEFPRALGWSSTRSSGYLVIPIGMGATCDFSSSRKARTIEKLIYSGGQTGLTMPLFGIVDGDRSLGCIVGTPFDCKIRIDMNKGREGRYSQTPVWVIDERTNTERRAHYFTQMGGDYVSIAKRYRAELIESDGYVPLARKAKGKPEIGRTVGSILGHRSLAFTEPADADPLDTSNAYGYFRAALRAGFDRAIAHDVLRGDPGEMRKAARFARSLCPGFRLSVYENYLDIFRTGEQPEKSGAKMYPAFDESLVARRRDGSMRPNWRVRRKGKPDLWTYTVCAAKRLFVALPQMDRLRAILGRGSIYIDVEGAVPLFDCYDPRHPVTKEEDAALRIEILEEVKRRFGVVTTESLPQDFLAAVADVGSYFSVFPYSGYGNSESRIMPPLIPVPLHTLVWHGSLLNQTGTGTSFYQSDPPHAALFGWLADTMDDKGRRIAYKLRGTAHAELLSHAFLSDPRVVVGPDDAFHCDDVQMTRFSDGTVVLANFASIPYRWQGKEIPSMDFSITNERLALCLEGPAKAPIGGEIRIRAVAKNTWDQDILEATIVAHSRGVAHREEPVFQSNLPALQCGMKHQEEFTFKAPEQEGKLWTVVAISIPGPDPWQASEIIECSVEGS